jgi:hypothetical protein
MKLITIKHINEGQQETRMGCLRDIAEVAKANKVLWAGSGHFRADVPYHAGER